MPQEVNRPSVEQLIAKAEAMKLDAVGVKAAFEHPLAPGFADQTNRWLPDSELAHDMMLEDLASFVGESSRVLDLGAGTGRLTQMVLTRFPNCEVVAADYSETMRTAATDPLGAFGQRSSLVALDFFTENWPNELGSFDAVVSAFAIHHGESNAAYRSLYERIHGVLRPGGLFINLDHVAGADRASSIANASAWRDYLDCDGEIESDKFILGSYMEDSPISIAEHSQLLQQAGFVDVEVPWRKMIFALYRGKAGVK